MKNRIQPKQYSRINTWVKMQVASISSFLHRPGQVQYLQVQSIATDPHLCKKGYLNIYTNMQNAHTAKNKAGKIFNAST